MVVPDTIEPYTGYKCLRVLPDGRLCSLAFVFEWPTLARAEAFCGRYKAHSVPARMCGCGIYAAPPDQAAGYFHPDGRVMVEVALWGEVMLATRGARGQYAYPQRIVAYALPKRLVKRVARAYQIPIEPLVELPKWQQTDGWRWQGRMQREFKLALLGLGQA